MVDNEVEVVVREAGEGDAEGIIAHLQDLSEEPDSNVPVGPGEFDMSVEEEAEFLRTRAEEDNSIVLVAEVEGRIVGVLTLIGGHRKALRHAAVLGISVHRDFRGRKIGSEMLERAIEWAKGTGVLTRIKLEVYERNVDAVRLYERYGFKHEGIHPHAVYQHGQYLDGLSMGMVW